MTLTINTLGPSSPELNVEGRPDKADYEALEPRVGALVDAHGKIGMLIRIGDFTGWSASALWEDLKFEVRHFDDIARLALVGEDTSGTWMAAVSKPCTSAAVEYFREEDIARARKWVTGP